MALPVTDLTQVVLSPIVICGYSDLTVLTLRNLQQLGRTATVLAPDLPDAVPVGSDYVRADFRSSEVLSQLKIQAAQVVLLLQDDDQGNFETALTIRDLNPRARIVSHLFNQNLARYLDTHLPQHFSLSTSALVSPAFALRAVSEEFIGYFALPGENLASPSEKAQPAPEEVTLWNIIDLHVGAESGLLRMSLAALEDEFQGRVLFHYPLDQLADFSDFRVFGDFDYQAKLGIGDRLVLICGAQSYLKILERNGRKGVSRVQRWAAGQQTEQQPRHWWQRLPRPSSWRLGPLSQFLALTLGIMMVLGMVAFMTIGKSPLDAIFATIVALREGYGNIQELQEPDTPDAVKVVAVFISLVGTAFVALLYGFLTDKLLSSRIGLGKAAIIPKAGHVVVVGLGRLGYRVLQLLRQMDYEVVAIDEDEDNPLIEATRQEGVAVLVGDSTLAGTLERANIARARCLICGTSNDLANLETALTAQALHPALKTILRVTDPHLAERMERHLKSLGVGYSPASLAAPAFATAAMIGAVFGTISWEGETLLATLLETKPNCPHLGMTIQALSQDYDLVILVLRSPPDPEQVFPKVTGRSSERRLQVGDKLHVLATLGSLSRLARRRPLPPEVYYVKLERCENSFLVPEITAAISVSTRQPKAKVEALMQQLPTIITPPLDRDTALSLARKLRAERAVVYVVGKVAGDHEERHP